MQFTFNARLDDEGCEATEVDFDSEEAAIEAAADFLQGLIDFHGPVSGAVRTATTGVGVGHMSATVVRWLGEWEFAAEPETWWWSWSPGGTNIVQPLAQR